MDSICFRILVALLVPCSALAQVEVQRVVLPELGAPGSSHSFGNRLQVDQNTAVVAPSGSPRRVVTFDRAGDRWRRAQVLTFPNDTAVTQLNVAMGGDVILVARLQRFSSTGRVHLLERQNGSWAQAQLITPSLASHGAEFGSAMAVDGARVVIAAQRDSTQALDAGSVFVFERVNGIWLEQARLTPPLSGSKHFFGQSVDIDGDLLVVGQRGFTSPNYHAFIYRFDGVSWNLEQRLDGLPGSRFGESIATDDGRIAVGASSDYTQSSYQDGAIYLYTEAGGQWTNSQTIWPTDPLTSPGFGTQVDLDGPRLVVGALDGSSGLKGSVEVYSDRPGGFVFDTSIHGMPGDGLGWAVALDRGVLWVGAPGEGVGGVAHVYALRAGQRYCESNPNSSGGAATIQALGSTSIEDDDLEFRASPVPDTRGVFAFAINAAQVPFGNGFRCISGAFSPVGVVNLGTVETVDGVLRTKVNFGSGAADPLNAGTTWHFQAFFRDPGAAGVAFDTSDATRVTLRP